MYEIKGALQALAAVLQGYLVMLALWVTANSVYRWLSATRKVGDFDEPNFDEDYFGRVVTVAEGVSFQDQHLVLEYSEGRKIYRGPQEGQQVRTAAASSLHKLASAAAAGAGPTPVSTPGKEEKAHNARDLSSPRTE